jgi:putative transcriptional regulator
MKEVLHMEQLKDIMITYGLSLKALSDRFKIPYRTVQNWVGGKSNPPGYVINMIGWILALEDRNRAAVGELTEQGRLLEYYDSKLDQASDLLHDQRFAEAIDLIDNI